jgi:hypothetical protein
MLLLDNLVFNMLSFDNFAFGNFGIRHWNVPSTKSESAFLFPDFEQARKKNSVPAVGLPTADSAQSFLCSSESSSKSDNDDDDVIQMAEA